MKSQFDWKRLLASTEEDYRRECLIELRWNGKIACPHCKNTEKKIYHCKNHKFRCSACDKRFSATSGTVLHSTKLSLLTWFHAFYQFSVIKTGISSYTMADLLNTTQMTAWRLNNRLRMGMNNSEHFKGKLSGVVQVDESYVGGKNYNRHANKKVKNSQGRSAKDKTPILGMVSPEGKLKIWRMRRNDGNGTILPGKSIRTLIKSQVDKEDTIFSTDEFNIYNGLDNDFQHIRVNHKQGNYVSGAATTNRLEGFWSRMKKALGSVYCGRVNHKNLLRYCKEMAYRYMTRGYSKFERAEEMLSDCLIGRYRKRGLYLS